MAQPAPPRPGPQRLALLEQIAAQGSITRDSTEKLELHAGAGVVALIKAGGLELQPLSAPVDPARNALNGWIEQVLAADDDPSEVRIGLASGQTLCALVEAERLAQLVLRAGDPVRAQFAASQVLLGPQV